ESTPSCGRRPGGSTCRGEQSPTGAESAIRARFVPDSFHNLNTDAESRWQASHCDTEGMESRRSRRHVWSMARMRAAPERDVSAYPGSLMAISFSTAARHDARARGAGVTAVLGPTNTGKTHLA